MAGAGPDSYMVADEFQPEYEPHLTESSSGSQLQAVDLDGHLVEVEFEAEISEDEEEDEGEETFTSDQTRVYVTPFGEGEEGEEDVDGDLEEEEGEEEETTETVIDIGEDGTGYRLADTGTQQQTLRFLCPDTSCRLRLPSRSALFTHMNNCHCDTSMQVEDRDEEGDLGDALVISELEAGEEEPGGGTGAGGAHKCLKCAFTTTSSSLLLKHLQNRHLYLQRNYACPHCNLLLTRKFHLVRHIKTVHESLMRIWQCDACDYKSNNQAAFKKHLFKCTQENTWDLYSEASVPKGVDFKCVCTWCEYKSNKYSMIKKHVEIFHEKKNHYSCKECVFIGRSVDDYAEHYNSFHKTDSYRHACTDCSFKCTNRLDLRNHYIDCS